ncbi:glycerophosphodiester phosphodiesterase family protein [Opisthorchis viverrini]|uniref:Glycerophosphodiester phosphodiesterase family protein n=1 Tax=Opisthorchis viverrini TaxID=6198 RepID=A0A1S8WVS8_OPIVI|nr:glycerophosphodiester phosphodiesterase family protein [Opisthorchis viverrini]
MPMSRSLLVYIVKSKLSFFKNVRVQSIVIDGNEAGLGESFSMFNCNTNSTLSWRKSGVCALDTWIPISESGASGFLHTLEMPEMPSLYTVELKCTNESNSIFGSAKVPLKCSTEDDQGVACVSIEDATGSELDSLYLYYLFAHAYNPPACKTAPPRSVRVSPVRFHQANAVNNGGPDGLWPLQTPILIGHAGAGMKHVHHESDRLWPDNTICAFRRAEQLGLPMVECDATVTKDYKAVLLHHNFTVRFHTDPFSVKDCNRSFNLAHLPDPPVDEQTTNLVVRYSFSELRGLLGRDPSARPIEDSSSGCITHPKALTSTDPLPDVQGVHGHPLPELADAFRQTSTQLGFNVELKYPRETLLGKITRAIHEDVPITPNLAGPHSYFAKINKFCDKILDTIWKNAGDRVVILSSFNADVCAVLRLKQSHLPVMFITRGGVPSPTEPPDMFHVDLRHTSLAVATSWAQIMGLDGVVTLGSHFGSDPKEHPITEDEISQNASDLTEKCLACFVYGSGVSEDEFFAKATKYGLTGVIIDRVDGYVQEHCDGISL